MGYFSKAQIENYVRETVLLFDQDGEKYKPLTPIEKALGELAGEHDTVGFFYTEAISDPDVPLKMCGKLFVKVDHDLYCDDRFAADLFKAAKEGKTVTQVIKERTN